MVSVVPSVSSELVRNHVLEMVCATPRRERASVASDGRAIRVTRDTLSRTTVPLTMMARSSVLQSSSVMLVRVSDVLLIALDRDHVMV